MKIDEEAALFKLREAIEALDGPMSDGEFDAWVGGHVAGGGLSATNSLTPDWSDTGLTKAGANRPKSDVAIAVSPSTPPTLSNVAKEGDHAHSCGPDSLSKPAGPSEQSSSGRMPLVPRLELPYTKKKTTSWKENLQHSFKSSNADDNASSQSGDGFSQYAQNINHMATTQAGPIPKDDTMVYIRFEVTDCGIGMTKDEISCLFKPFSQLREGAKQAGSSGLGLTLVKAIVERLNGGILATSPGKNKGSTFVFFVSVPAPAGADILGYAESSSAGMASDVLSSDSVPSQTYGASQKAEDTTSQPENGAGRDAPHSQTADLSSGDCKFTTALRASASGIGDSAITPSSSDVANSRLGDRPIITGLHAPVAKEPKVPASERFGMAKPLTNAKPSNKAAPQDDAALVKAQQIYMTSVNSLSGVGGASGSLVSTASRSMLGDKILTGTVLVVDDTAVTRQLLSRIVKKTFPLVTLVTAEDGAQALQVFAEHWKAVRAGGMDGKGCALQPINCVLMDKSMPVMDGFACAVSMRNVHHYEGHIVGVTGNALQQDVQDFKANGATSVLTKPVDRKLLQAAVRAALNLVLD
jgi:CheY-like chemotaxis protein